jgi:sugar lactone lactonase YvrE
MTSNPVACTTEQCQLGEGTRWDNRRGELLRVDILAGRVYRDEVAADGALVPVRSYQVSGTVGAVAPIHDDQGWLLAADRGFTYLSPSGRAGRNPNERRCLRSARPLLGRHSCP